MTLRDCIVVEEYDTDGEFVRIFGQERMKSAVDVTVVNDGCVMVLGKLTPVFTYSVNPATILTCLNCNKLTVIA